jgi:hypothetical protein
VKKTLLVYLLVPALALAQSTTPPATDSSAPSQPAAPAAPGTGAAPAAAAKPAANNPLANAVQARTPEEQANQSGFQLVTTLDHYLGTGTFVNPESFSSLSAWLTVIPQYLFSVGKQRLVASAVVRGSFEYTLPDASTGRRFSMFDTRVGVSAPALFREKFTKIAFTPSLGLTLPTSLESWNAGLIASINGGITMTRSIATVDFRLNVAGSGFIYPQAFSGYRNPDPNNTGVAPRDTNGNLLAICRPGETFCSFAGMNPLASLSVGGQIQWRATGSFLLYAGYTYIKLWRRAAAEEVDAYTPKALDSNGNPVARSGPGSFDRTSAFVGGSYQLNEHYNIDLGISTVQTPLVVDSDGVQRVRFPFFSVFPNDNATSFYFTLTAAY